MVNVFITFDVTQCLDSVYQYPVEPARNPTFMESQHAASNSHLHDSGTIGHSHSHGPGTTGGHSHSPSNGLYHL